MEEFDDVGALVESTGVISVTCKADSVDAGGGIIEGNGPIASCENKLRNVREQVTYHPSSTCM